MFKIKSINRETKWSEAKQKNYIRLTVITEDGRRATGFGDESNIHWASGYEVPDSEATIVKEGKWYNIKMLKKPKSGGIGAGAEILKQLEIINKKLDTLIAGDGIEELHDIRR